MNRPGLRRVLARPLVLGASTALVASLALSGCGVSVVDDDQAASPTVRSSGTTTGTGSTPAASPTTDAPSPGSTPDGSATPTGSLTYAGFAARFAKFDKEIPCDRGPVELTESGPAIRLVGSCGEVTISGSAVAVIADEVASATVSGSGVVLMTKSIGDITLTSDAFASEVYWVGGQPNVTDNGAGNTARSIEEGP